MKKIKLYLTLNKVVRVTEDHGGYEVAECIACGASGWLEGRLGHPYGAKDTGADLKHKQNCPVNQFIDITKVK